LLERGSVSGFGLPREIQNLMLEMQIEAIERRRKAVLADPIKHRATLEFPESAKMNWRYWQVKGKRGPRVRYCYSTERNLAGYFLCWREVWDAKAGVGKRDLFVASKRRTTVKAKALQRYKTHQARIAKTAQVPA
jgi:hypothetical protein